jgi:Mycotoxin biosynthesis protein UstYa
MLFVQSILLNIVRMASHAVDVRLTNSQAPILKDVNIKYDAIRFNGSLLKENVYRKPAAPEVDAAWKALGVDYRSVVIPSDQAADSGLLPDQVKISEKYGGGFVANVEGLHQLHCLVRVTKGK